MLVGVAMGFTIYLSIIYMLVTGGILFIAALLLARAGPRHTRLLLLLGLLALVLLLTPLPSLTSFYESHFIFPLLVVPIVLVLSALLILSATRPIQTPARESHAGSSPPRVDRLSLLLSGLILLLVSYRLYWFLVWDSTGDSIGLLFLMLLLTAAIACGFGLAIVLRERSKTFRFISLFAFPVFVIGVYALANQVDFRLLTIQRQDRIGRAVEVYYEREGRYPRNLQQLIPRYLFTIPEPVFIYGQDWCYEAGEDGFQLAYLARDHWSSPYLAAQAYHPQSDPADLRSLCEEQIETQQQRQPWTHWQIRE